MSRDGSTHIYGVPIYTVYILYIPYFIFPDIRACVYGFSKANMVNTVSCASLAVIQLSQHFGFELRKLEETLETQSNHSVCRARLWGAYLQNNLSTKLTCLEVCLKSCTKPSQFFSRGASQDITRLDFKQLCDAFEADRAFVGLLCWP